jgi:murein DD-endopeptidase MepM/ murein hydrolase activator NlpD
LYAHQSSIRVSSGQSVRRAQHIGNVGTTGWSTGCHLHFEVRINGEPVDPVPYLT